MMTRRVHNQLTCILLMLAMILSQAVFAFAETEGDSGDPGTGGEPAAEETCEHEWSDWTITSASTYISEGSRERTCLLCGETETSASPRLAGRSKWVTVSGSKYYLNADGSVAKGWNRIKVSNSSGAAVKWCWFDSSGVFRKSISKNTRKKWVNAGGKRFYFTASAKPIAPGFRFIGSKLYYFGNDRAMVKGKVVYDGRTYTTTSAGNIKGLLYKILKYKTFVLVDISDQKLYFYKDSHLEFTADVITGGNRPGTSYTPTGSFRVQYKKKNIKLNWAGRQWPVTYWIAFKGTLFGFHDANWRSDAEFSDPNTHIRNGSHGCVNMRKSDAAKLYSYVKKGTRVFIQK